MSWFWCLIKWKKVLLIIPAYNEKENKKLDFIVIIDGSKDNTKKFLEENNIPHINSIYNLGIGGTVQTWYKYALENNYDNAVQFYVHSQHDVRYAEKLIKPIVDGKADFTIGSRFIEELSNLLKHKKVDDFYRMINKICIIIFSMSIVISICAYTIGPFCLQLLYGLSFDKFRILFCVLVLAGTFNFLSSVYSNELTILKKTKEQIYIYLLVLFVCYFISLYLTTKFSIQGLLTSYLLSMIIQYVLFVFVFKKYIKEVKKWKYYL